MAYANRHISTHYTTFFDVVEYDGQKNLTDSIDNPFNMKKKKH